MTIRLAIASLSLVGIILSLCAGTAGADSRVIPAGETVFIGEEGLDITAAGVSEGSVLAFYGTGGKVTDAPAAVVTVADPTSFYISPSVFSARIGPWFVVPGNALAFYVQEPTLQVRVIDHSSGFSVGPGAEWVPKGDSVGFRIDTNLWVLSHRPGCTGVPLTIWLSGPGALTFSSVSGYSLRDIVVSTPTFETGPVWGTGSPEFPSGDYTVFARCEENNMYTNYPLKGRTESEEIRFLLQRVNPLITPSPSPSAGTLVPTGTIKPSTLSPEKTVEVPTLSTPETGLSTPPATPMETTRPASPTPTAASGPFGYAAVCAVVTASGIAAVKNLREKRP